MWSKLLTEEQNRLLRTPVMCETSALQQDRSDTTALLQESTGTRKLEVPDLFTVQYSQKILLPHSLDPTEHTG